MNFMNTPNGLTDTESEDEELFKPVISQALGFNYSINDDIFCFTEEQKKLRLSAFDLTKKFRLDENVEQNNGKEAKIKEKNDEIAKEKKFKPENFVKNKEDEVVEREEKIDGEVKKEKLIPEKFDENKDDKVTKTKDNEDGKAEKTDENQPKFGLVGMVVDKDYGGKGGNYLDLAIVAEEFSRISAGIAQKIINTWAHCIEPIHRYGTKEQKLKYLTKLCNYESLGCMVMDASMLTSKSELRAEKQANYYILNGHGTSGCSNADILIVYAITKPNTKLTFTVLIVEKSFEGYNSFEGPEFDYRFDNCKVPMTNVLGDKNNGSSILFHCNYLEALLTAAVPVGSMQAACDFIFQYTHSQKQFDNYKSEISGMHTKLCACRNYLYTTIRSYENGYFSPKDWDAVLLFCIKKAKELRQDAKKILGKNEFTENTPIKQLLKNIKLCKAETGSDKNRRNMISSTIAKEYSQ